MSSSQRAFNFYEGCNLINTDRCISNDCCVSHIEIAVIFTIKMQFLKRTSLQSISLIQATRCTKSTLANPHSLKVPDTFNEFNIHMNVLANNRLSSFTDYFAKHFNWLFYGVRERRVGERWPQG